MSEIWGHENTNLAPLALLKVFQSPSLGHKGGSCLGRAFCKPLAVPYHLLALMSSKGAREEFFSSIVAVWPVKSPRRGRLARRRAPSSMFPASRWLLPLESE